MVMKQENENGLIMWACTVCGHATKQRYHLTTHIEAKHIQSDGFPCMHCNKLCPSKNALGTHVSRYHRNKDNF